MVGKKQNENHTTCHTLSTHYWPRSVGGSTLVFCSRPRSCLAQIPYAAEKVTLCPWFCTGYSALSTRVDPMWYKGRHVWGLSFLMLGTLFRSHEVHALSSFRSNVTSSKRPYQITLPHIATTFYPLPFLFFILLFFSFLLTLITTRHINPYYLFLFLESEIPW